MLAYLVMMTARLIELRRVLKPTGSLYLHCDPVASHYLKTILDTLFGVSAFRNEIIWRRYGAHNDVGQGSRHFGRVHDVILFYTKSENATWNQVFRPYDPDYIAKNFRYVEPDSGRRFSTTPLTGPGGAAKGNPVYEWNGHTRAWRYNKETMEELDQQGRLYYSRTGYVRQKHYLDEARGVPVQDVWDDIYSLSGNHAERLGYPTQKPLALLERIIEASSNPGDVVLDPFCGCGTAIAAAEQMGRTWLGIDITYLAINLQKYRLNDMFGAATFEVIGEPETIEDARALAAEDPFQFEAWATSLVNAMKTPNKGKGRRGADRGIDGIINFVEYDTNKAKKVLVQVKGGGVKSGDIRDLVGTITREGAAIGVFITLNEPTREMKREAYSAGFYHSSWTGKDYPVIQILTIQELFDGAQVQMPPTGLKFMQAARVKKDGAEQPRLID